MMTSISLRMKCKFGNGCERIMCMFQHDENNNDGDDEQNDEKSDEDDDESEDDEENDDKNLVNVTDLERSMNKVEDAMEKVNILLQKQFSTLKCDLCEFEARNSNGLNMHKKTKHTDNSKWLAKHFYFLF